MSYIQYISLPRESKEFSIAFIKESMEENFRINSDFVYSPEPITLSPDSSSIEGYVWLMDKMDATFKDCFKQPFIYELQVYVPVRFDINKLNEYKIEHLILDNQALYTFIKVNLATGEFVEIYESWLEGANYNFDPPTSDITMDYTDVLDMPMSFADGGSNDRPKLTIYKTD